MTCICRIICIKCQGRRTSFLEDLRLIICEKGSLLHEKRKNEGGDKSPPLFLLYPFVKISARFANIGRYIFQTISMRIYRLVFRELILEDIFVYSF
jgi:hypothetical protein